MLNIWILFLFENSISQKILWTDIKKLIPAIIINI